MQTAKQLFVRFMHEDQGAGLIEYVLLVALIALASLAAMTALGGGISNLFTNVSGVLAGA